MTTTIVFIHGAWVTADCWDRFVPFFEAKGYHCLAPSWPGKERPVEAIRADPSPLAVLGLGAAGVAIDSAPPKGVWAFEPTALRSLLSTLLHWRVWRMVVRWKYSNFRYAFVHTLPEADARATYDRYVVPESGRIFFQSAIAMLSRSSPIRVNFANATRAPLLLIAGAKDRIVPAVINRRNHRAYAKSPARTDFREFPDRTH